MAPMTTPTPGLYEAVLQVLGAANSWTQSAARPMADLIEHLTVTEAERLPEAISDVLPLLRQDPDRLRFAAEIAARFDFFETAEAVFDLAVATDDRQLLLNAADLSANPAATASLRQRILDLSGEDHPVQIRLDAATVPQGVDAERLYDLCWPGNRADPPRYPLPPVVVLDTGLRPDLLLRQAVQLDRAGATVRRLDPQAEVPFWFGPETVLVCRGTTRSRVRDRCPQMNEARIVVPEGDELPEGNAGEALLLRRLNAALAGALRTLEPNDDRILALDLWSPDVFRAGVYSTREAGFLAGAKASTLNYLGRHDLLQPSSNGVLRWRFSDVVAVRTWAYLRMSTPGRVSSRVVSSLAAFEGGSDVVKLGVTADGSVMVDRGKGFEDVLTGQMALDLPVTDVDAAFRPFDVGGGNAPGLPYASPHTTLNPIVLNGTPHLTGKRIAAKDLASLDRAGGSAAIIAAYPELKDEPTDDVVEIGHRLLAAI